MGQKNINDKLTALRFITINDFKVKLTKYQLRIVPLFFLNAFTWVFVIGLLISPWYVMFHFFISPEMTNADYIYAFLLNALGVVNFGLSANGKPKKFWKYLNKIVKNYFFAKYVIKYGRYFGCNIEIDHYIYLRKKQKEYYDIKRINEQIASQYPPRI